MRDPRNMTLKHVYYHARIQEFLTGGGVQIETFFSPQLILQRGGGNGFIAEKTILSQGSRGGSNIFRGGPSKGGSKC